MSKNKRRSEKENKKQLEENLGTTHIVTDEDLVNNPELVGQVEVGDEITLPPLSSEPTEDVLSEPKVEDVEVTDEEVEEALKATDELESEVEVATTRQKPGWAEQSFWDKLSEEQKARI